MADNVKGITIQIGGDVQPLNQALAEASKSAVNYAKKLEDINNKLRLDPRNVELLTQKQKLLNEAIAISDERLGALKKAYEQALGGYKEGSVAKEEVDALGQAVHNAELENQNLKTSLEQTNNTLETINNSTLPEANEQLGEMEGNAEGAAEGMGELKEEAGGLSMSLGDITKLTTLFGALAAGAAKLIDSGALDQLGNSYSDLKSRIDDTIKSTEQLLEKTKTQLNDAQSQSTLLGMQADQVEKLNKQLQTELRTGQDSTKTKMRLKQQVDLLNKSLGEEVITLNRENGLIETNSNYWQNRIKQAKEYVLMQANLEVMQDLWVQEAQIQAELDEVNQKIANGERGIGTSLEYKRHQLELDLIAVQEQTANAEENYQKQAEAYAQLGEAEVQTNSYVMEQMELRRQKNAEINQQIYDNQVEYNKKRVDDATETEKKIKGESELTLEERIQNMIDNQKAIEDYETNIQKLLDHAYEIQDEKERERWLLTIQSLQDRNKKTMDTAEQLVEDLEQKGGEGAQRYVDAFNEGLKEGHIDQVFTNVFGKVVTLSEQYGNRIKKALTISFDVKTGQTSTNRGNIKITAFAQGGIVTRPTNALVGEAGPEAIIPLDRLGDIIQDALADNRPTGGNYTMNVYPQSMSPGEQDRLFRQFDQMFGASTSRRDI